MSEVPQLDHHSLAAVFSGLSSNTIVLAVKSLSKFWCDWARQQLKHSPSTVYITRWIPLWALKQRGINSFTTDQQDRLMVNYASVGDLEALDWLYSQLGRISDIVIRAAAWVGKVNVLSWAKSHGSNIGIPVLLGAAGSGNVEVLDWLEATGETRRILR